VVDIELRHLRYFVAVAEELHFTRAAQRLHVSQPPLSQQIKWLEARLGTPLFERTQRRVALTAAGAAMLPEARAALAQVEVALRAAQRAARGETGRLRIGFVPTADFTDFPKRIRSFRAANPDVEVDLHTLYSGELADAIRANRIDAGLLRQPFDSTGLATEVYLREGLVAALPKRHPLARRRSIRIRDLAGEPWILFPRSTSPGFYDLLIAHGRRGGSEPRIAYESETLQTTLGMIAAGAGVSLMPESVRSLERRGVVYRPIDGPCPVVELVLAWREADPSPVLARFLALR